MMIKTIKDIILKTILKDIPLKTFPSMTVDQEMGLFSQLYDNDAFQKYLNARERYLINKHTEDFISGQINNSFALAGQLIEVRNMRERIKIAYKVKEKQRHEEKKLSPV